MGRSSTPGTRLPAHDVQGTMRRCLTSLIATVTLAVGAAACGDTASDPVEIDAATQLDDPTTNDETDPVSETDPVQALVGLDRAAAEQRAAEHGKTIRVIEEDGEVYAVTADIDPDRIDVVLVDGVVTQAIGEGQPAGDPARDDDGGAGGTVPGGDPDEGHAGDESSGASDDAMADDDAGRDGDGSEGEAEGEGDGGSADGEPEPTPDAITDLVGLDLATAEAWAAGNGYLVRVVAQDGEELAVTMDHDPDRINVAVVGQQVVEVRGLG